MKNNRILIRALTILLVLIMVVTPVMAEEQTTTTIATKNETVYGMLASDGSVEKVFVVNQLLGEYTDYGEYTEIQNLSTTSEPVVEGDKIYFSDENVDGGLFYQGTIDSELPVVLKVKYYLDGKLIDAENLGGATGHLKMVISYKENSKCPEAVRDGLTSQISVTLDMGKASNIVAEEAVTFIAGNTMTINYTVLPGDSGEAVLEADIKDFEMDPITVNLMKSSIGGGIEDTVNELQSGFDDMFDGASELVDGTTELQEGMESLLGGVRKLKNGMAELASATGSIESGMKSYGNGLTDYLNGISQLGTGSQGIQTGLDSLSQQGSTLASGLSQVNSGLSGLSSSSSDLKALAQSLQSNSDPNVQALAQGTLQILASIDSLASGLDASNTGVSQYVAGVQQMATEYSAFNSGVAGVASNTSSLISGYNEIAAGVKSFNDGVEQSASGVSSLYYSIRNLPDDVQALVDGQIEFKDGIADAKEGIEEGTSMLTSDDSTAVSFVSPEKNYPASVQYIITINGIEKNEIIQEEIIEEENENFWTRLLNLFTK